MNLKVITASTRPGRVGPAIAAWAEDAARRHGRFAVDGVDLAALDLPLLDEPNHPRLRQYQQEHTHRWSRIVDEADAFVFVTPEYNFGPAPSLINALDYLYQEWAYKPASFVSYGGVSGGLRAVQIAKLTLSTLRMAPIVEAVVIPFFPQHLGESGAFQPTETHEKSAADMLDELYRWAEALKPLRAPRTP